MNKVSVGIPSYNSSSYIRHCIENFLSSKYINEIIISDDFSRLSELNELEKIVSE